MLEVLLVTQSATGALALVQNGDDIIGAVSSWLSKCSFHATYGMHLDGKIEEGVNEVVRQEVGLQSQVNQLCALGIVVVLLCLYSRVGHVCHLLHTGTGYSAMLHAEGRQ